MMRFGTILVLGAALLATPTAAQLPLNSLPWTLAATRDSGFISQDSSLPRLVTFQPIQADSSRRHKSPFLAWFLSWVVPGGGQGYNGQWGKAAAFFVPAVVGFALVASNDGFACSGDCGTRDVGLALLVVSSVGSQIEAPIAASKINREARKASPPQVSVTIATVSF